LSRACVFESLENQNAFCFATFSAVFSYTGQDSNPALAQRIDKELKVKRIQRINGRKKITSKKLLDFGQKCIFLVSDSGLCSAEQ
jgi:macrodomain Ter protein organizer (MatP/YcbG family)